MSSEQLVNYLNRNEFIVPVVIAAVVLVIIVITVTIARTIRAKAFELSRREIAAYVAEGTIPPEQAAALLALGAPDAASKAGDAGKRLAELVAWYQVSSKDAAKLIAERATLDEDAFSEMVDLVAEGMGVEESIKLVRARKSGPAGSSVPGGGGGGGGNSGVFAKVTIGKA